MTIKVAHDFICPWCWIGFLQTLKLTEEFGVDFEWVAYELMPEELEWGVSTPPKPEPANRPRTLSRFEFLKAADGIEMPPIIRPRQMRTHQAHTAVELAKEYGKANEMVEALYRALYERGERINDFEFLAPVADALEIPTAKLRKAIEEDRYADKIIHFDDPAYATGVYNVPTFYIGEERYAEMPYSILRTAMAKLMAGAPT